MSYVRSTRVLGSRGKAARVIAVVASDAELFKLPPAFTFEQSCPRSPPALALGSMTAPRCSDEAIGHSVALGYTFDQKPDSPFANDMYDGDLLGLVVFWKLTEAMAELPRPEASTRG